MPWTWGSIQTKHRRPIESLVLDNNMAENLLRDSREFLALEDWCVYLLGTSMCVSVSD